MITFFVDVTREYRKVVIERRRRLKRKKKKEKEKRESLSTPRVMRRFLQCRELHGIRDSVLLGRYYIFLLKIKVLVAPFVYTRNSTRS